MRCSLFFEPQRVLRAQRKRKDRDAEMIDLTGKVILVTGGSKGIGAVTVRTLVNAGAEVILHYCHSHQAAESVAASVARDRCYLLDLLQNNFMI